MAQALARVLEQEGLLLKQGQVHPGAGKALAVLGPGAQGMARVDQKDQGVAVQVDVGQLGVGLGQVAQQQVQLVLAQQLHQAVLVQLLQGDLHVGVVAPEHLHGRGDELGGAADGDAHPQAALVAADHPAHLLVKGPAQGQDLPGLFQINFPQVGGHQPPPAPLEQGKAQGGLHPRQVGGQGGLGDPQLPGGLGHAAAVGQGDDIELFLQIHGLPSIRKTYTPPRTGEFYIFDSSPLY